MSTDFEKGLRKTIDLSVKSKDFTVDVLKSAMNDFLSGKSQKKGRVSMKKLSEHSGKLENVEIKGIEDFLNVAKKYDIDYAVKKEPNNDTYHVFFQAKWKILRELSRNLQAISKTNLPNLVPKLPDSRLRIWRNRLPMNLKRKKRFVRSPRK